MARGDGSWQDGRRAWERLVAWHQRGADDGEAALSALSDIGAVRRLLEQAELEAVRAARGAGRAWAEIATGLGVTRQSAWEKWRDLDDTPAARADAEAALTQGAEAALTQAAEAALSRASRRAARRAAAEVCVVPDVVGLTFDDARAVLFGARLVAIGPPDHPSLVQGWPRGVVVKQDPSAGAVLAAGSAVTLWLDSGGGAGDREPRRPKPTPMSARELPDEVTDAR
jgi:hypothetical protein